MRVFVTGGTGFIGQPLVEQLLQAGHQVMLLTRQSNVSKSKNFYVLQGEFHDLLQHKSMLKHWSPDACVHLAWNAKPGKYLDAKDNSSWMYDSIQMIYLLHEVGCRHVVMAGTCAEYDLLGGYVCEDAPLKADSLYAASKLSLFYSASVIAKQLGMSFAWGRVFFMYGPHEDARKLVASLINHLLDNKTFKASAGEQIRDFLHVSDVATAFVTLVEKQAEGCFNISSGVPISLKQLMTQVKNLIDTPADIEFGAYPYREWDPMFICGNNSRLKALGWKPDYLLYDGLKQTVGWWRTQGVNV